jgi:CubicO group peptidase (beta-lactamase class C family)
MTQRLVSARIGLLALGLSIPLSEGASAQAAADARSEQVDALFADWNKPDSPGCAIGVMSQGELVYAKGYGLADVARGIPLSQGTVFDIASMTKQFTGATIGLLTLERKLALTDDVRARFPELHIDVPVTVDNLLHHTSGLRDYAELNQLRGTEPTDNEAVLALLGRQESLNFAPGSESVYSNSNYVVLAELVQRIQGKSLAALARERIFSPLKMRSTRFGGNLRDDPPNLANSYFPAAPGKFVSITRASQTVGDGNLLTPGRDLALWDENFYSNRVGGKALAEMMRTPATLTTSKQAPYGFGLMFGDYRGAPTEAHGGSYHGFRTELLRFPRQHFSVAVLCNVASANASALAAQIADIYLADVLQPLPKADPAPVEVKIDPQVFDEYVGEYAFDNNGERVVMMFGRQGERFFFQPVGQSAVEIFAASETEFFMKVAPGRIAFERGPDGTVNRVTLHRTLGDLIAQRIVATSTSPPQSLDDLAGIYYSQELDAQLGLSILDGRLTVNNSSGFRTPLAPRSEKTFALPGGATFEFSRGNDGQVSGFEYSSPRVRGLKFVRREQPD